MENHGAKIALLKLWGVSNMRLIEIPDDGIIRIPIVDGDTAVGQRCIDLSDIPTIGAVPVCRCKDCNHFKQRCCKQFVKPMFGIKFGHKITKEEVEKLNKMNVAELVEYWFRKDNEIQCQS